MGTPSASDMPLALSPDIVVTPLPEGALLLHLDSKFFYSINLPGWAILQLLETGASHQSILSQCTDWGATASDQAAIVKFLDSLADNDLAGNFDSKTTNQVVPFSGTWEAPTIERHDEPLEKVVTSAFDPSVPLAE